MRRSTSRRIGTDRVTLQDDRLLVVSHVDMEGWDVRQHRAALIRFDGRTWRVASKTTGEDKTIRYALVPWRPGDHEITGPEIDFDKEYVALRDQALAVGRRRGRISGLLRIVAPLTGFLPARTKARFEAVYGIDPMASTFQSVFSEFIVALGAFALSAIGIISHGIPVLAFLVIAVVATVDAAVRYDRILREERPPPGFYEWLFRRRGPRG